MAGYWNPLGIVESGASASSGEIMEKVNLSEKFGRFSDHWSPKVIAELNDYQFKLVRISGSFIWHEHESTDEAFIVLEGSMTLDFEDQSIHLDAGEMIVVPKGCDTVLTQRRSAS